MSTWPLARADALVTIWTGSPECLGPVMGGGNAISVAGGSRSAWVSQRIQYLPFWLNHPLTVTQLFLFNGTVSGNLDMGLYDVDGRYIVSKGSTAMSGANTVQTLDITDTQLDPGEYYLAMWADNGTATFSQQLLNQALAPMVAGVFEQLSQSALPTTTATFVKCTSQRVWYCGLSGRTVF